MKRKRQKITAATTTTENITWSCMCIVHQIKFCLYRIAYGICSFALLPFASFLNQKKKKNRIVRRITQIKSNTSYLYRIYNVREGKPAKNKKNERLWAIQQFLMHLAYVCRSHPCLNEQLLLFKDGHWRNEIIFFYLKIFETRPTQKEK